MINTSSAPSALLSNLGAVPAVHPTPAAQRAGSAREAPQQRDAERQPAADNGFARAMKQAMAQRANKPAAPPARAPAHTPEPGANAEAALARKAAAKGRRAQGDAASDNRADAAESTRPAGAETAAPGATGAANPTTANAADATAAGSADEPSANASGSALARRQAHISGARRASAVTDSSLASGAAALNRSLAEAANATRQPVPAATKDGDTGPGGATPLPRPQPPTAADATPELMQAALAHSRALSAVAAETTVAANAEAADAHALGAASGNGSTPRAGDATRARATDPGAGELAAQAGSGQAQAAASAERSMADQGQTGGGGQQGHRQRGADATQRAAERAAAPGALHASAAVPAREAADSGLRAATTTPPVPAASTDSSSTPTVGATQATGVAGSSPLGTAPAATASAELSTRIDSPVNSPAFAAEAGYRIAVLVREGVESAQLQLNPAEMGPVTVQIVIEGQTAQVHLAAAHADTRQALEASMPQLASNLRESGLTLTGGGVSEQAPGQQGNAQDGGSNGDRGSREGNGNRNGNFDAQRAAPAARGGSHGPRRGVVDLVA